MRDISRRKFLKDAGTVVAGVAGLQAAASTPSEAEPRVGQAVQANPAEGWRFGIQIEPQFGFTYDEVVQIAKEAERLGFYGLWASDHLFWDARSEQRNCLEAWTLLTALAPVTTRLRLGTLVTCNSYRPPSILAKIASSLDHLSNGRLEFGIGAGWKELEYRAYGIPFPSIGTRLAQLEEAVQVVRLLWTQERASFSGTHYQLQDALCAPKPMQQPPRIWIAGGGEKVMLRIVAQYADGWNILLRSSMETVKRKTDILRRHCDAQKRDFSTIEKSLFLAVVLAEDEKELKRREAESAQALGGRGLWASRELGTAGTPERLAETLRALQALGFHHFQMVFPYKQEREMLQRFAELVVPQLG